MKKYIVCGLITGLICTFGVGCNYGSVAPVIAADVTVMRYGLDFTLKDMRDSETGVHYFVYINSDGWPLHQDTMQTGHYM